MSLSGWTWPIAGMLTASAIFWLQYVDLKDRLQPEPRSRMVAAFGLGVAAAALAWIVFELLDRIGCTSERLGIPRYCFLVIGPVEEGAKIALFALWIRPWRCFDERVDGFVYAAALSLGFATLENSLHLPDLPWFEQVARAAALPLTHTLFAAVWGFAFAHAKLGPAPWWSKASCLAGGSLAGMALHGAYDYLILEHQATAPASLLVFLLWAWLLWRIRKLVGRPQPAAAAAVEVELPVR